MDPCTPKALSLSVLQHNTGLMAYPVRETCYTLQGEGAQWGRPAVFYRFAGCNKFIGTD
jgi:hypothetical protein